MSEQTQPTRDWQRWLLPGRVRRRLILGMAVLEACLAGCVGTDFITGPISTVAPKVVIDPTVKAVQVGHTASFQATYYDSLGNLVTGTTFQWISSNPSIASIDANGMAVGNQQGQVQIVAKVHGVSSSPAILTVVVDSTTQVATVTVTPSGGEIRVGDSIQFTAAAFNLNGTALSGRTYTWRSTNTAAATVDQTGKATGIAPGSADIIATADGIDSAPARLDVRGPQTLSSRSGTFTSNPATSYDVRGTATLQEQTPGGSLVLNFGSDFSTSSGPGIYVFLSANSFVNASSLNLGRVKKLSGAQSYAVPDSVRLTTHNWVIIRCVPFSVTFGYAQLQ